MTLPPEEMSAILQELIDYLSGLIEAKMRRPGDDLMSRRSTSTSPPAP